MVAPSTLLLRCSLIPLLLTVLYASSSAQVEDSVTIDRLIHRLDSSWSQRGARLFLADRIERRSPRWIVPLLQYAEARDLGRFLTGQERILLQFAVQEYDDLLKPDFLVPLLKDYDGADLPDKLLNDDLAANLLDLSRKWRNRIIGSLPSSDAEEYHATFLRLLLQATTLVGIRGVEQLNGEIDSFVFNAPPGDALAAIADRYLRRRVDNNRVGIGVGFRYRTDGPIHSVESPSEVASVTGPGIGLHLFYSIWRADLLLYARRVSFSESGDPATSLEVALEVGPDLLSGAIVLRPTLGMQVGGLAPEDGRSDLRLLTPTVGLELATYQLFDDPPHLLFGVAGGYGFSSLSADEIGSTSTWSMTFFVALSSQTHSITRAGRTGE